MCEGISFSLEEANLRSSGHLIRSERGVEASAESVHPMLPQIHCSSHSLKCCVKRLFRHRSVEFQLLHMILDFFPELTNFYESLKATYDSETELSHRCFGLILC